MLVRKLVFALLAVLTVSSRGTEQEQTAKTVKHKPHPVLKMDKFVELLERNGIALGKTWQTTPTEKPVLDDDYFGDMCNAYPSPFPVGWRCQPFPTLERSPFFGSGRPPSP